MKVRLEKLRILDFDVETRPIAWYGGDFVTKQPTAIAWKWIGTRERLEVRAIGESDRSSRVLDEEASMLGDFVRAYREADMVAGHFIRGFDLTVLNGALMRLEMDLLEDKLTCDTKLDLPKVSGLSKSMENLGAMYELKHPKVPMDTAAWARGNMLIPDGIARTKKRVVGDVREHIELRARMLELGVLGRPRRWSGTSSGRGNYHA